MEEEEEADSETVEGQVTLDSLEESTELSDAIQQSIDPTTNLPPQPYSSYAAGTPYEAAPATPQTQYPSYEDKPYGAAVSGSSPYGSANPASTGGYSYSDASPAYYSNSSSQMLSIQFSSEGDLLDGDPIEDIDGFLTQLKIQKEAGFDNALIYRNDETDDAQIIEVITACHDAGITKFSVNDLPGSLINEDLAE